jgi:hypothetical protein
MKIPHPEHGGNGESIGVVNHWLRKRAVTAGRRAKANGYRVNGSGAPPVEIAPVEMASVDRTAAGFFGLAAATGLSFGAGTGTAAGSAACADASGPAKLLCQSITPAGSSVRGRNPFDCARSGGVVFVRGARRILR